MNFLAYPFDIETVRGIARLMKLREIHDRIIVATAQCVNASIVTKDEEIVKRGSSRQSGSSGKIAVAMKTKN